MRLGAAEPRPEEIPSRDGTMRVARSCSSPIAFEMFHEGPSSQPGPRDDVRPAIPSHHPRGNAPVSPRASTPTTSASVPILRRASPEGWLQASPPSSWGHPQAYCSTRAHSKTAVRRVAYGLLAHTFRLLLLDEPPFHRSPAESTTEPTALLASTLYSSASSRESL